LVSQRAFLSNIKTITRWRFWFSDLIKSQTNRLQQVNQMTMGEMYQGEKEGISWLVLLKFLGPIG
jgi:hypothetical protein